MKKLREGVARRIRRPVKFTYPATPPAGSRKKRWLKAGIALALLLGAAYLGYAGRLGSAADWRLATAPLRHWLWPGAAPVEDDPEEEHAPALNEHAPPASGPTGLAWIAGGWFWRGCDIFADALPLRKLYVDGFWIDPKPITNRQFQAFVEETGYVTLAERKPLLKDFPGLRPESLGFQPHYLQVFAGAANAGFPGSVAWGGLFHTWPALEIGSLVFTPPRGPVNLDEHRGWWQYVPGACWRQPQGPGKGGLKGLEDHPVVQVCWHDATAYCQWRSKKEGKSFRLPTEAEWEFAARGGLDRKLYAWGDELTPGGKWMCNIWQGDFPLHNDRLDGFETTSPPGAFPPNGYGLYDMAGNVWQWCSDWYQPDYYKDCPQKNPAGPRSSYDPNEPGLPKRVQRGGSFLCCENYCVRYLPGARGKGEPGSAANHVGFRCVAER